MTTTALFVIRFGLDATLKVTILLALLLLPVAALRRLSAATRHLLATLGLAGTLALPLTAPLVPSIRIPLLPSVVPAPVEAAATVESRGSEDAITESGAPQQGAAGGSSVAAVRRAPGSDETEKPGAGVAASASLSGRNPASPAMPRRAGPGAWAPWVLLVWASGAVFSLARLAAGSLRVRAIARNASPLRDRSWLEAAGELSRRLSLRRRVRLLTSAEVPVAMTAGLRRPVLLLHHNAHKWPADRRRVVLLHELAHIRRADWLTLLVAELAAAVYWFHPLVWVARREARTSGERACDDLVLDSGTKPSVYAAHLLGIVRSFTPGARGALPVMAMAARPSQFEGRMRAILDPGLHRRGPSRGQVRAAALGLFASVIALAALQPWAPRCAEGAAVRPGAVLVSSELFPGEDAPSGAEAAKPDSKPQASIRRDFSNPPDTSTDAPDEPAPQQSKELSEREVAKEARQSESSGFLLASNGKAKSGSSWYSQAMDLHHDEDYDGAISAFEKAIELGYREGASSYNIACGYARKGERDRAFEWLRKAEDAGFGTDRYLGSDDDLESLRSDPRFQALKREARQRRNGESRDEAKQAARRYEQIEARASKRGDAYFDVARQLLKTGEYALSAKAYRQAAERGYRPGTSFYNAACALALGGEKADALDSLQKALENGFDDPKLLRKDDDLDSIRSESRFRDLQALADELTMPSPAWSDKLLRSTERTEWRNAAQRAREVAAKHPRLGRVWFSLGFVELKAERPEAAAEAFTKALELGYRKPTTLYNLACSYARLDQKDRAFDFLFQALDAGFDGNGTLRGDEDLDNLRGDPRFRKAQKLVDERSHSWED